MKPDELSFEDLHFWYDPLIQSLVEMQKIRMKRKK